MKKTNYLFFILLVVFISCAENESSVSEGNFTAAKSGFAVNSDSFSLFVKSLNTNDTLAHYRGLNQLGNAFFISGTKGKILIKTFQLEQTSKFKRQTTSFNKPTPTSMWRQLLTLSPALAW